VEANPFKKLIKWLYFKYVYPDEVKRLYKILDESPVVTITEIETEWTPPPRLH
jgi:hypothetical protein